MLLLSWLEKVRLVLGCFRLIPWPLARDRLLVAVAFLPPVLHLLDMSENSDGHDMLIIIVI